MQARSPFKEKKTPFVDKSINNNWMNHFSKSSSSLPPFERSLAFLTNVFCFAFRSSSSPKTPGSPKPASPPGTPSAGGSTASVVPPRQQQPQAAKKKQRPKKKKGGWWRHQCLHPCNGLISLAINNRNFSRFSLFSLQDESSKSVTFFILWNDHSADEMIRKRLKVRHEDNAK